MKRFRPYFYLFKPVKWQFAIAILAGIIASGASAAGIPLMFHKIFPIIFSGDEAKAEASRESLNNALGYVGLNLPEDSTLVLVACLMLPLTFVIRGVSGFINSYLINYCGLKVLEAIRVKTFSRLQSLSLSFHQRHTEGDVLSRVLTDTNLMQTVLVRVGCDLIVQPFTLIWAFAALIYLSIVDSSTFFMLIAMLSVPVCVFPIRFIGKKLVKKAKSVQSKLGDMTAMVSENLASQREIRAYNMQGQQVESFVGETSSFLKFQLKVVKYGYMIGPAVEMVAACGIGLAVYYGSQRGMTLESFMALVSALYFAYEPIKKLGSVHGVIKTGEAALDRIEEIIDSTDEIEEKQDALAIESVTGNLELSNINFRYGKEPILKNISVSVPAGQTVALVGPSGAGKSTFVSLIPRFYDVQEGAVKIDGHDVKDLRKQEMREHIALVSQTPLLFRGTIADNIALGKKGSTREQVEKAAKQANAYDFIMSLPGGFESVVGERGEGLSGGQRQRVAIARAFLRDAPILILDEATSSLDAESEAQIQEELQALSKGRTTFLIAHRFSSIRHADRILVFSNLGDGGEIISDGSHEELYQSCATYKQLYDKQST